MLKDKRAVSVLLIGIMVCAIYLFAAKNQMLTVNEEENIQEYPIIQENDEVTEELSIAQENNEMPEEFYSFDGKWIVGEYIDSLVESTGVDTESEEYKENHARYVAEYKEKYEGYTFEIAEDSILYFGGSSELGYQYNDYSDLFIVFRQPSTLEIVPPFLCASVHLKELDEWFDIIIDSNGKAIFEAGYLFFELDKVNEEALETAYNRVLEDGETFLDGYQNLILEKDVKRAALIYLDEDDIPELLVLKNGEYHLYACDGTQITAIAMPDAGINAGAYGPKHFLRPISLMLLKWKERESLRERI